MVPPFISRYWVAGDRDRLERLMRAAATATSAIAMMALILLIVLGKPLLSTFFGTGYEAAWSSMVVLAIGYSVQSLTGQAERVLALVGGERVVLCM